MAVYKQCFHKKELYIHDLPSLRRQWVNWTVVLFLQLLISVGYWAFLPTMHQFITNPTEFELLSTRRNAHAGLWLWPGLGETEYVYSWIVTAYALGEVVGAAIAGSLAVFLPYYITIPMGCVVHIIAGLLYALTVNAVMIFTARFLLGIFAGYSLALLSGYLGESADRFEGVSSVTKTLGDKRTLSHLVARLRERKKNTRTRKDLLFIINAFSRAITNFLMLGISSIVAHFPSIHQFRWPGWFVVVLTSIYMFVFVLVFEQPHQCYKRQDLNEDHDQSSVSEDDYDDDNSGDLQTDGHGGTKFSWRKKCCSLQLIKHLLVYSFILLTGYIGGSVFTVIDTLLNPILSDHFGFTIVDISYFILIATTLPILAAILLAIVKTFAIDNRKVLAGAICSAIVGGIIMSDWQALATSDDPCPEFFDLTLNSTANSTIANDNFKEKENYSLSSFLNISVSDITDLCVNASTSKHTCYWNPRSRITGKYCSDCTQRCDSIQSSLYFTQLCVGWMMIMLILPIIPVLVNVIASDYTPTGYQGVVMGGILVASGLSRIISPLWSDWTYEVTDKHTYAVMTVKSSTLLLVLILLLVFYKYIGPKTSTTESNLNVRGYRTTATNSKHLENGMSLSRTWSMSSSSDSDTEP